MPVAYSQGITTKYVKTIFQMSSEIKIAQLRTTTLK